MQTQGKFQVRFLGDTRKPDTKRMQSCVRRNRVHSKVIGPTITLSHRSIISGLGLVPPFVCLCHYVEYTGPLIRPPIRISTSGAVRIVAHTAIALLVVLNLGQLPHMAEFYKMRPLRTSRFHKCSAVSCDLLIHQCLWAVNCQPGLLTQQDYYTFPGQKISFHTEHLSLSSHSCATPLQISHEVVSGIFGQIRTLRHGKYSELFQSAALVREWWIIVQILKILCRSHTPN